MSEYRSGADDRRTDDWDDWPDPDADARSDDTRAPDTETDMSDTVPAHSLQTVGRAATPTGSVEVRTTMQGLPTAIHIERSEMDKPASTLAKTILLLCKQAGTRAGAVHRAQLIADGHSLEALSYLNLPSEREAAAVDDLVDAHLEESEPDTWMRRI